MNEFVGKICPYCKTAFKENDEIVVCSVCDMPHHKDCWVENQGCTTFGCQGTIKSADGSPSSVISDNIDIDIFPDSTERIFCTRCGAENYLSSDFCCKCGNRLGIPPVRSAQVSENINYHATTSSGSGVQSRYQNESLATSSLLYGVSAVDPDAALYVGKNSEYYIPRFNELKTQGKKVSWNWCAFLFAPYWMIYRKMYAYGAAVLGGAFILSFLGLIGSLLSWGAYITFGLLGNYIYMLQIDKNLVQGKYINDPAKTQFVGKVGGVNTTASILAVVGYAILVTIINFA